MIVGLIIGWLVGFLVGAAWGSAVTRRAMADAFVEGSRHGAKVTLKAHTDGKLDIGPALSRGQR